MKTVKSMGKEFDLTDCADDIFVVVRSVGEYSDRSEDVIYWTPSETEAQEIVTRLDESMRVAQVEVDRLLKLSREQEPWEWGGFVQNKPPTPLRDQAWQVRSILDPDVFGADPADYHYARVPRWVPK